MSKRREVNEVVLLHNEEDGFFLGRIDSRGFERGDECPLCSLDNTHDQSCKEWPNVEVLSDDGTGTGQYVYHVSECDMRDSADFLSKE